MVSAVEANARTETSVATESTGGVRAEGVGHDQDQRAWRRALVGLFLLVTATSMLFAGGHSYAIDNEVLYQTTRATLQLQPSLEHADPNFLHEMGAYRMRDDGEWVSIVGIGQPLIAVPLYLVSELTGQAVPDDVRDQYVRLGTFFTNSFVLGATAVLVALLARELDASRRRSLGLGLVFAFGTYAFVYGSMFFTELTCAALLCFAALQTIRGWNTTRLHHSALAGASLGFGFVVRPSVGLFFAVFGLCNLVAVSRRFGLAQGIRSSLAMAAGAFPLGVAYGAFAWWRFGSPIDLGYAKVPQSYPIMRGLLKQLAAPGKSFFIFAPVTLLAFAGGIRGWKTHRAHIVLIVSVVAVNFLFYARVPFWAGDNSWGPRYAVIVLPLAVVLVAPVLADAKRVRTVIALALIGLLGPVMAGTFINMNTLYYASLREVPEHNWVVIHHRVEWQQIWRNWLMLPEGINDVVTGDVDSTYDRPAWDPHPDSHHDFYSAQPRIDFWWLWVRASGGHWLSYIWFVPIVAGFAGARRLLPAAWRELGSTQVPASTADVVDQGGRAHAAEPITR